MTTAQIELRLAALEKEVADLKLGKVALPKRKEHPVRALEKIHGTFEDDDAFKEAMHLGRKWRKSQDNQPRQGRKAKSK